MVDQSIARSYSRSTSHNGREQVADAIARRLRDAQPQLKAQWETSGPTRHFVVDDLLDPAWVRQVVAGFPAPERLLRKSSLRERKRVGIDVERYAPEVGDALFAFQDARVVEAVGAITGIADASADPTLYASGVSVMGHGDFLNPHIDNSHDGDRQNYRVLNLLYYISEGWSLDCGGNLELWDRKVRSPRVIESRFNRLVVMATHHTSWHSVNRVRVKAPRRCVSNYYFSPTPPLGKPVYHVTTFTGRPEQPLRRLVLNLSDGLLFNFLGKNFPQLTKRTKHRRTAATV